MPQRKLKTWRDYANPVTVRLPVEAREQLRRAADEQGLTTSQVLQTLVTSWTRRYRRKKRAAKLRPSKSATRRIITREVKSAPVELTAPRTVGIPRRVLDGTAVM